MPTHAGMNQSFDIGLFPPDDQRAIRRFARHFYITRAADAVHVGNSRYRSFLMRPADELSVVLNVEREVPVLFSDYDTFEARTLNAFEPIFEQFDDVRVDRSFRVLVSRDPNIEQTIRHYLTQDPEYPILSRFITTTSHKQPMILSLPRFVKTISYATYLAISRPYGKNISTSAALTWWKV